MGANRGQCIFLPNFKGNPLNLGPHFQSCYDDIAKITFSVGKVSMNLKSHQWKINSIHSKNQKILTLASQWPLKVVQILMTHAVVLTCWYYRIKKMFFTLDFYCYELRVVNAGALQHLKHTELQWCTISCFKALYL